MAADGSIVIDVILDDGSVVKGVADLDGKLGGLKGSGEKAALGIGSIVSALGLVAVGAKAIDLVKSALDGAISRYDALNSFPLVMQQIGFSAEASEKAINRLSDGIQGLPTTLDSVASTAQRIAIMTNDLDGAVEITLALNNAFISSGASQQDAARGLDQYVQMLAKGEVDLQSWRTLQETMGVALNDVAKAFGFAGKSAQNDLYDALKDGTITFDQFNSKIIELDGATNGFAERALTASGGIATSWQNVKTAIVKGVADVIRAIDEALGGTGEIEKIIDKMKTGVQSAFKTIVAAVPPVIEAIQGIYNALKPWVPLLAAVVAGFVAFGVINSIVSGVSSAIAVFNGLKAAMTGVKLATDAAKASQAAYNLILSINPWVAIAAAVVAAAILVYTYWEPISQFFIDLWEIIKSAGLWVWDTLSEAWNNAVEGLKEIWANVPMMFEELWASIQQAASELWSPVANAWNAAVDGLKNIWTSVTSFFSSLWSSIQAIFSAAYNFIDGITGGAFSTYVDIIKSYMTMIWNNIKSIWDYVKNTFTNVLDFLKALVKGDFEGMKNAIKAQMENARELISSIWNNIKTFLSDVLSSILSNVRERFENIKEAIRSKLEEAKTALVQKFQEMLTNVIAKATSIVTNVRNKFEEAKATIRTKLEEAKTTLVTKFSEMVTNATTKASEIVATVKTKFQEVYTAIKDKLVEAVTEVGTQIGKMPGKVIEFASDMKSAGEDLILGLIGGIKEMATDAIEAVAGVIDGVVTKAKSLLKIASPSKVFHQIGRWTGEGLALGIELTKKANEKAIASVTGVVTSGADKLSKSLSGMSPQVMPELSEMNAITQKQLEEYAGLYKMYFEIARQNVNSKLNETKENIELLLDVTRVIVIKKLEELRVAWLHVIVRMMEETEEELKDMYRIGRDAGQGFLDGLTAMEPAIIAKAVSIANAVKAAMASALQIHSPSRWMRDFIGRNMMLGWIKGIDREKSATLKKAREAADWMKPDVPEVGGFVNKLRGVTAPVGNVMPFSAYGNGGDTVTHSNSKSYNPTFNNYFTRAESTPSEAARKQKQQSQRQAMEWGLT